MANTTHYRHCPACGLNNAPNGEDCPNCSFGGDAAKDFVHLQENQKMVCTGLWFYDVMDAGFGVRLSVYRKNMTCPRCDEKKADKVTFLKGYKRCWPTASLREAVDMFESVNGAYDPAKAGVHRVSRTVDGENQ